jgi:probable phosphoglycerate mutase
VTAGRPPRTDRNPERVAPPAGVRTTALPAPGATRLVLVRHGEAVCNVEGVVGGRRGCTGLTARGEEQVRRLAARLAATGELAGTGALYASVLRRAVRTAEILAPAIAPAAADRPLEVRAECALCELHPGEADGLFWEEFAARYPEPDWDADPSLLIAPGGESWTAFVDRAAAALEGLVVRHRGQTVVVACHAGVIEASMLRFLPVSTTTVRLGLRTEHASVTEWEQAAGRWLLRRYNDVAEAAVQQA